MKYKNSFIFTVVCGLSSSLLSIESPESVLAAALSQSSKDNTVDVMRRAKQTIINESLLVKENLQANTLTVVNGGVVNGGLSVQGPLLVNGLPAVGPAGPAGANGAAGPAGPSGISSYVYLSNTGAQTIGISGFCSFTSNLVGGTALTTDGTTVTVVTTGLYSIQFYAAGAPTGGISLQAQLSFGPQKNGDAVMAVFFANNGATTAEAGANQVVVGSYTVALTAGDLLRICNVSVDTGGAAASAVLANGIAQINATCLILRLA